MSDLFTELRRRNVFKVAIVYVITAWVLAQVADLALDSFEAPVWVIKAFLMFLALGFPVAVIFAWAFEVTPEGIKKEKDVDRSQSITQETGQRLNYFIIGMLVLAVGYFAVDKFLLRPEAGAPLEQVADAAGPSEFSIAVLPFVNMSADAEQEYFSDGISEELLNLLAKVKDFRVAGRTSSFAFKGENQDLREVGAKLNVAHVLEGSVRKSGDQVRITAQLVNVDDGYHLWSESYDRELDNIFQVQDEIAQAVVAALKTTLLGDEPAPIRMAATPEVNAEAYDLYLRAKFQMHKRSPESLERALNYYQRSIELDPGYAPAWAGVAMTWLLSDQYSNVDHDEALNEAEGAINRAFEITDSDADTWAALGLLEYNRFETETAMQALNRAIEINPNHTMANMWLGNVAGAAGDSELQFEQHRKAFEIDRLHHTTIANYAYKLMGRGLLDEARDVVTIMVESYPERGRGQSLMGDLAFQEGDWAAGLEQYLNAYQRAPDRIFSSSGIPWGYIDFEEIELADRWLNMHEKLAPNEFGVVFARSDWYLRQGRFEEMVAYSEDLVDRYEGAWFVVTNLGNGEFLNGDPEAAIEAYRLGYHESAAEGDTPLVLDANRAQFLDWYAAALIQVGETERAREIAGAALEILQQEWDRGERYSFGGSLHFNMAVLHAVQGNDERALAELRQAVAAGTRDTWRWKQRPSMAGLQDNIGFITLVQEVEADIAEQHARLQEAGLLLTPEQALTADL